MNNASLIDGIIQKRHTVKALSDAPYPSNTDTDTINEIIAAAGWAPYHKAANLSHREGALSSLQPWRCYALDASSCRSLRQQLLDSGDTTKIPKMLAVADSLIQVTWLPDPDRSDTQQGLFEPTLANMEHIAAASAAIQNMLIAATARDLPNYWSSGGALRSEALFDTLGIPAQEILLGALFIFPKDLSNATTSPGSMREKRGNISDWSRWVKLPSQ